MVDAVDNDELGLLDDFVHNAIGASSCRTHSSEFTLQGSADSMRTCQ